MISKLATAVNEEEDEEIYGEIPEKYLCALMSTVIFVLIFIVDERPRFAARVGKYRG